MKQLSIIILAAATLAAAVAVGLATAELFTALTAAAPLAGTRGRRRRVEAVLEVLALVTGFGFMAALLYPRGLLFEWLAVAGPLLAAAAVAGVMTARAVAENIRRRALWRQNRRVRRDIETAAPFILAVNTQALRAYRAVTANLQTQHAETVLSAQWRERNPDLVTHGIDPEPRTVVFTYDVVTPESAEQGDTERAGFSDASGAECSENMTEDPAGFEPEVYDLNPASAGFSDPWPYWDPDEYEPAEYMAAAVVSMFRDLSIGADSFDGVSAYGYPETTDYATGEETTYAGHFGEYWTPAELAAVAAKLRGAI